MSERYEHPWDRLETPHSQTAMNSRRVDFEYPWDFFWAKDVRGSAILLLRHDRASATTQELPKLRGLEIESIPSNSPTEQLLLFRLLDPEHIELFHSLCLDIMEACKDAESEAAVVEISVRRTWRWHRLLSGGRSHKLSPNEQQGLIAELFVLQRRLFACLPVSDSLRAWTGPDSTPRDFEVGRISVEAKARRGSSRGFIEISSAEQLDTRGADRVFLSVTELDRANESAEGAFTLDDVVESIASVLKAGMLTEELDLLDSRLYSVGYDYDHDYSMDLWVEGRTSLFEVRDGFPRIEAGVLPAGIDRVNYSIQLSALDAYQVSDSEFNRSLTSDHGEAI